MTRLSFVSLNIEKDKHFDTVIPFLEQKRAGVVCIQELLEEDIPRIEAVCGSGLFVPMARFEMSRGTLASGIGIFSHLPLIDAFSKQYAGFEGDLPLFNKDNQETTEQFFAVVASVEKDGSIFRIATTHFPWTPNGESSDFQRVALKGLFGVLSDESELVLCGDFNAPRGGEIFSALAAQYTDNIPLQYVTSLDPNLHRAGKECLYEIEFLMVDGLFSTPQYNVSEVALHRGISDHCAVTATIQKTQ